MTEPGHGGLVDTAVCHGQRNATRCICRASREGSSTDGLRGFERNHGNVASPGRLPSDWLFLAFPPIPWILARVSPRRAARYRRHCPIIIYGGGQRPGNPSCDAAMADVPRSLQSTLPSFVFSGETLTRFNLFNLSVFPREESFPASRKWTLVVHAQTRPVLWNFFSFRGSLCFHEIEKSRSSLRDVARLELFLRVADSFVFQKRSYGL